MPPLRFPEFTDEWKTYKVSDVLDFYSTNSLSWDQLEYSDGELRNLHYGLIHVGLPTLVNLKDDLLPTIKEGNTPKNYTLCLNGDVAFADASEDTNDVAKAIELVETDGNKVVFGLHTIHGRDNKGLTTLGFKGYAFSSKVFHDQIKCIAQGTKIYSISSKNFTECYIGIPSKAEQSKIARLLSLLDRRIAAQSGLIEDLQKLKAALCNTIFSTMKTKIVKVGELAEVYQPRTISQRELMENARYLVYGANGIIGKYHNYNHEESQVCITCRGNTCGAVCFTQPQSWITGNAMVINVDKVQDKLSKKFLYYYLCGYNFTPIISGSGQPQIVRKPIEDIWLPLPTLKEQIFIVKKIDAIENKLQIENKLVDLFSKQKQYLLQQMFI